MRQHKLALCKGHFLDWIPEQTEKFIQKYHMFSSEDSILIAVSGGKDSLSLWDILWRLGYKTAGLYIGLGIDAGIAYSNNSLQRAENFAEQKGLLLHTFDIIQNYGYSIPEIAKRTRRGKGKPCSVCGLAKRQIMNRFARENDYNVLLTGHNLDDEAAVLFANTINWLKGYIVRQGPVLDAHHPGLVRKAKPLFRFYEREMAAYALLRGIEYVYEECPFAIGAKSIYYKEYLNTLENDRPGAKLSFYLSFLRAKDEGLFAIDDQRNLEELNTCPTCEQPTSVPGECAFCRLIRALPIID